MELTPDPNEMLQITQQQLAASMAESTKLAALLNAAMRRIKELEDAAPPAPAPLQAVA